MALRLQGMAAALDTVMAQAEAHHLALLSTLGRLADMALEQRFHNALALRWRQSKLADKLPIEPFDCNPHKSRHEQQTRLLHLLNLDCGRAHMAVMLSGNPGAGKTFLAKCLASAAWKAHIQVRFTTAIERINHLMAAEAARCLLKKLQVYQAPERLVCDELGYLPVGPQGAHLFLQAISARHHHTSTVITTHLPFADWGQGFDSPTVATALAARRVYNSEVLILGGASYRRKLA